jgi:NAD(P)-dependent dehydrogenase (short-subunit alcohol dehydrogenase family)
VSDWINNPASLFDVRGKVAVLTGASGAFGRMAAHALAAAGAKLVLAAGNAAALSEVAASCRKFVSDVEEVALRPDSEKAADAIVGEAVAKFGRVDILVVGSGMNDVSPIEKMEPERFEAVMEANVTGSWLMARAAAQRMIEQGRGGKIVLMSSARGILGHPAGYTAYCASKSAVDGIVRALGCELGKYAITTNAIAPTVFRSELTAWMFEDTERANGVRSAIVSRLPAGRLGEPSDLVGPLLFLCSQASDFYTGHVLYADGGYTAG